MIAVERRSTVRGQAAAARKKIAAMQIRDDEDDEDEDDQDDDEEEFKKLFGRQRTKKSKDTAIVPTKKTDDLSDVSVSYFFLNLIFLILMLESHFLRLLQIRNHYLHHQQAVSDLQLFELALMILQLVQILVFFCFF
jgi:hypothetical protein